MREDKIKKQVAALKKMTDISNMHLEILVFRFSRLDFGV
jgi:hypothetical protein